MSSCRFCNASERIDAINWRGKQLGRRIGIFLIRCYQRGFAWMPPTCRFTPSCSQYTLEAIDKYGLLKGSWMGFKRICRCGPWHPGGNDPVP